jgi:hypothetical protein
VSRECGPVIEVIEPDEYGGVKIVFGGKALPEWRCVRLTAQHWEAIQNWCSEHPPGTAISEIGDTDG